MASWWRRAEVPDCGVTVRQDQLGFTVFAFFAIVAAIHAQINYPGSVGNTAGAQRFTTSGTFTPPAGVQRVWVRLVGAGGGSASVNHSGGGGAFAYVGPILVTGAVTVTVGVGGTNAGTDGGASSFGTFASAGGGVAGGVSSDGTGGTITSTNTALSGLANGTYVAIGNNIWAAGYDGNGNVAGGPAGGSNLFLISVTNVGAGATGFTSGQNGLVEVYW